MTAGTLGSLRAQMRKPIAEQTLVASLRRDLLPAADILASAHRRAMRWVETGRANPGDVTPVERAMESFPLDSVPGKALMSLAEALLRTPDPHAADMLLAERLRALREPMSPGGGAQLPASSKFALSALAAVGKLLRDPDPDATWSIARLTAPLVAPMVRGTARRAIRRLSQGFIAGESIHAALERGTRDLDLALCSFDMLGEGARTADDARRYFSAYQSAIAALATQSPADRERRSSISVKLSALEPRYAQLQHDAVLRQLVPVIQSLAASAARANIGMTIDAEEADRLDLSLDIIEAVARDPSTAGWGGLGIAVQAYNRHATIVIDWVVELARTLSRQMTVRIVKGAYWDAEIKRAQERGLETYPVFTAKSATDLNYLSCVRRLFAAQEVIYPQIATHNAMTISAAIALAPAGARYEFQRLHGMGTSLYGIIRVDVPELPAVRVYAPVGIHEDLLPYLVRRLLENGANSSFVHQFRDARISAELVVRNPLTAAVPPSASLSRIPEPASLYGSDRLNSEGVDWGNREEIEALEKAAAALSHTFSGGPIVSGTQGTVPKTPVFSPSNSADTVGLTREATPTEINAALDAAEAAQPGWDATPVEQRAAALIRASGLLEVRRHDFVNLLVREAGKSLPDAIAEIREAVDFCRYYAARARESFGAAASLPGPTGERNLLSLHGRGVFVCISPWNFPLAIFTGQIVAALVAGNSVVAKPAPSTTLIAHEMVTLLHEAGIPGEVLHLTPADGPPFSAVALPHRALAGVAFTGSTATAVALNRGLANRDGAIATLIAETGGVNAMIVDATALPEQAVDDLVASAFTSAGQRCSAARLVYIQEEIADRVIQMLIGAMQALVIGDPAKSGTDVGPLISRQAVAKLRAHIEQMYREAKVLYACELPASVSAGNYFPPHLIELSALDQLQSEQFGPILHVVRYSREQLPKVLAAIRGAGFALTLGIQSRLESLPAQVFRNAPVGNLYVNRNMIGATVGVQPFGGHGLSGTGPKAGGPHYLYRFATERTVTVNTTAIGGNPELLTLAG